MRWQITEKEKRYENLLHKERGHANIQRLRLRKDSLKAEQRRREGAGQDLQAGPLAVGRLGA